MYIYKGYIYIIRSQLDIVAYLLAPWSRGKEPVCHSGIKGKFKGRVLCSVLFCSVLQLGFLATSGHARAKSAES
jgi:hypothetical protein